MACDKCSLSVALNSSNFVEKLCDEWVLSTSVCGTGSFGAHTATHSTSESAHETQSFSTELRKTKKITPLENPPHISYDSTMRNQFLLKQKRKEFIE